MRSEARRAKMCRSGLSVEYDSCSGRRLRRRICPGRNRQRLYFGRFIMSGSLILQDGDGMICGLIVSFLLSVVVDKAIFGINGGKMALIVTEHGDDL